MKKVFLMLPFLLFFNSIISQEIYVEFNNYYSAFKNKYEVALNELEKSGYQNIYKYNAEDFKKLEDSAEVFHRIKYTSIEFKQNINLDSVFKNLELLPNLKLVKFDNSFFLKNSMTGIKFPNETGAISHIETIIFTGSFDWDWNIIFEELSKLEKLKNIAFISVKNDIFLKPNFSLLKNLEGIYYAGRYGPKIPEKFQQFSSLKTFAFSADVFNDLNTQLTKLHANTKIENIIVGGVAINDTISETLGKFTSLKRVSLLTSKIEHPELLFTSLAKNNKIIELKLTNNNLDTIPKSISLFDSLKVFYSSNNIKSKTLPIEFYSLKSLEFVEIQGSKLEVIDNKLNLLKNLKTLKLYFNNIHTIPSEIGGLEKLQKLFIQHNSLKILPNDIGLLRNLKELKAGNNQIANLPKNLKNLQKLDTLNLENNFITSLPKQIGNLNNLKYLNLENNYLKELPNSFCNLNQLIFLNLTANDLKYLPKNFGELTSLDILKLNSNLLNELPVSFCNLSSLKRLELNHNNLTFLPFGFGKLSKLESLYLNNSENFMFRFQKYDHLTGNFIKDTNERITRKTNNISILPKDFRNLKSLKWISISNNKNLASYELFELLKKASFEKYFLDISNCGVAELPTKGWSSIKVERLDLSNNRISMLPPDIKNNNFLTSIDLSGNREFNTTRSDKAQISLLFEEEGIINKDEQPKTVEMAIAYAQVSNKKYYSKEYVKSIEYANRAIEINEKVALQKINADNFIESLYKTKNYKRVIYYADIAIKKDTSANIRFLNSIIPNFVHKAKSHLAIGDTLQAIKSFVILSEKFNGNNWIEAGLLAKKTKQNSLSKIYFNKSFEFYINYLEQNKKDWGYHLSLLEAYFVSEEKQLFENYYDKLSVIGIDDPNYVILLQYFKTLMNVTKEESVTKFNNDYNVLKEKLKRENIQLQSWSFELLLDWNKHNNLNVNQKTNIYKLTNLLNKSPL